MSAAITNFAFLDLPTELIEQVLIHLHPLTVVICRQISKGLKDLIDASVELQFRIELAVDGFLVNCRGNMPATELLHRVKTTREAFETLNPPWRWRVEAPNSRRDHYEVCDGVWGRCMNRFEHEPFRAIQYEEMISPKHHPNRWMYQMPDLGIDVTDFSYWLAADLQILMEWRNKRMSRRIHFRTFSTNVPHPQARVPFVDIHGLDCSAWRYCLTLTHEDYFALLFTEFEILGEHPIRKGGAMVLNWKTGDIHLPYCDVSDIAFLQEELVLLLHDGRISTVGISIYSLESQQVVQVLAFPPVMHGAFRIRFLTHPPYGSTSPAAQAQLFIPDPAVEVLPIDIQLDQIRGPSFFMILSKHLFTKKCNELRLDYPGQIEFIWDQWAPEVTRLLPLDQLRNTGFRSTFGSRMLAVGNLSMDALNTPVQFLDRLVILDFNPRPIRRGAQSEDRERCRILVERERTDWSTARVARAVEPVYSSLPVRAFISKRSVSYLDIHLDGSTMICRRDHLYNIYSFLPRTESDAMDEEEEQIELL